jgi:hypothetical protein
MEGGRGGPAELHVAPIQKPAMEFPSLIAERAPSDQAIPDAQIKKQTVSILALLEWLESFKADQLAWTTLRVPKILFVD